MHAHVQPKKRGTEDPQKATGPSTEGQDQVPPKVQLPPLSAQLRLTPHGTLTSCPLPNATEKGGHVALAFRVISQIEGQSSERSGRPAEVTQAASSDSKAHLI